MFVIGVVITTVIATLLLAVCGFLVYWSFHRRRVLARRARVDAALRAWAVAEQEIQTDRRVREISRRAMEQMLRLARDQAAGS